jgi:hypothetical protein
MEILRGRALAEEALRVFLLRADGYLAGINVQELIEELRNYGVRVGSDNEESTLGAALNRSQERGTWRMVDDGRWLPGDGVVKDGLSGRPLAEALHSFVMKTYPTHEFHYEAARIGLQGTGVKVKGLGTPTRTALAAAPDLFVKAQRPGYWRWL